MIARRVLVKISKKEKRSTVDKNRRLRTLVYLMPCPPSARRLLIEQPRRLDPNAWRRRSSITTVGEFPAARSC